jgi:hypothetical protein
METNMNGRRLVIAFAAFSLACGALAGAPADARNRHHRAPPPPRHCVDRPADFGLLGFIFNPQPGPNWCSPPVYQYGQYVGQDPDPFIRQQLMRDPDTGYTAGAFSR